MDELRRPVRPEVGPTSAHAMSRATLPLLAGYWAFGQYWGVWVILVFDFQRLHSISASRLGFLYTMLSLTAVLVMLLVAPRLQPFSLSFNVPVSLVSLGVGSFAIGYLPTAAIIAGFVLVGLGNGMIDVYLNVAAQRLEVATRRPVLQWLHASYALGGLTGAAIAGLLLAAHVDFRAGLLVAAIALFATAAWNLRTAPRERGADGPAAAFSVSALRRTPALWVPAICVLFAFLVEGSMDTWSGLYLRDQLGASASAASIVFVSFSGAIFLGRMFAGKVLFGLGPRTTILLAGIGSAIGGLIAVSTDRPLVVGAAFLLLGFTISAAAPAGFSLTEAIDEDPASAIAAITTVGYTGFIWSPPLLGYIAQTADLRAAMGVVVVATLGIIAAGFMAPRSRR